MLWLWGFLWFHPGVDERGSQKIEYDSVFFKLESFVLGARHRRPIEMATPADCGPKGSKKLVQASGQSAASDVLNEVKGSFGSEHSFYLSKALIEVVDAAED